MIKSTFMLFPDARERDSVIADLGERMKELHESGTADLFMPFRPTSTGVAWPTPLRAWTAGVDPAVVVDIILNTEFEHPAHLLWRTDEEVRWSYASVIYRGPGEELP